MVRDESGVINTEPRLISIPLAAKSLGIGLTRMRELVNAGKIESVYIFSRRLIPTTALDSYVAWLRGGGSDE